MCKNRKIQLHLLCEMSQNPRTMPKRLTGMASKEWKKVVPSIQCQCEVECIQRVTDYCQFYCPFRVNPYFVHTFLAVFFLFWFLNRTTVLIHPAARSNILTNGNWNVFFFFCYCFILCMKCKLWSKNPNMKWHAWIQFNF